MKRRNNTSLQASDWWFHSEAESLAAHLMLSDEARRRDIELARPFASIQAGNSSLGAPVRLQKVLFTEPASLPREWFYELIPGASLRAYNHATRTGLFACDDGQSVTIQCAENWFARGVDPFNAVYAFERAQKFFAGGFGFSFLSSPTLTGLYAFESKLPYGLPSSEPSTEWREYLHANTTQARNESFLPKTVGGFYYYDRRFAYSADACLDLPCGSPDELSGDEATYQKYEVAWYAVNFNIPEGWQHIGLLPVLGPDGWFWPRLRIRGGYQTFVAEPELRLAIDAGWPVEIQRKWLFGKARPLEKPVKLFVALFERAKITGCDIEAGIYRRIVLQAIGALYARSFERETIIDESELIERNDAAALTAEDLGDGRHSLKDRSQRRESRFYQPEWAAYIWSRARARLNSAMLGLPFDSILGCHVDAIYTDREALTLTDNGRVGQFRLKGQHVGSKLAFEKMSDLSRVKMLLERKGGA